MPPRELRKFGQRAALKSGAPARGEISVIGILLKNIFVSFIPLSGLRSVIGEWRSSKVLNGAPLSVLVFVSYPYLVDLKTDEDYDEESLLGHSTQLHKIKIEGLLVTDPRSPLLIVGASSRAAAFSAHRAGMETSCVDLFADADLAETTAVRLPGEKYPLGLLPILREHAGPWLYTGALENYPELIAQAESAGELWGNSASVLSRVRDPFLLKEFVDSAGLLMPRCRHALPEVGEWLQKPFRSGCGTGIAFAGPQRRNETRVGCYYQEHIEGIPCSAVFVGFDGSCLLLGATRQFIGEGALNVFGFKYCGSIGPLLLTQSQNAELERMGNLLASEFKLRGLFGVDFLHAERNSFWMLEVNPRYSASVEVLERATGNSQAGQPASPNGVHAMEYHRAAFRDNGSHSLKSPSQPERKVAKAILFSDRDFEFPEIHDSTLRWPHVADIPHAGTLIKSGQPVMTIFSEGAAADECERELWRRVDEWKSKLWEADEP